MACLHSHHYHPWPSDIPRPCRCRHLFSLLSALIPAQDNSFPMTHATSVLGVWCVLLFLILLLCALSSLSLPYWWQLQTSCYTGINEIVTMVARIYYRLQSFALYLVIYFNTVLKTSMSGVSGSMTSWRHVGRCHVNVAIQSEFLAYYPTHRQTYRACVSCCGKHNSYR